MNLANTCNNVDNATFAGSELPNCTTLAPNIEACQAKGKVVTISLGGAGGGVGFSSDAEATSFADQVFPSISLSVINRAHNISPTDMESILRRFESHSSIWLGRFGWVSDIFGKISSF